MEMRKKMDEKKRKKYSKLYAYNINNQNNGIKQMAFKNLEKDFYEDIINSDLDIKKGKKNLEGIKDGTIKESVYTNRNIPDVWKTKLSYRQEVHDAISNDEIFAKYIGSINEEEKVDFDFDNKLKTFSSTYFTNDENKSKNYLFERTSRTNFDSIESNSDKNKSNISEKNELKKGLKKFFSSFGQPIINDKLIASKLDEYRIKFDMNNFMNEIRIKRDNEGKDKELKEMPNFLKERKRNYRNYLKSIIQNERVKVLRDAIYVNLLPPKNRLDEIDLEKNKKKKFNMTLPNKIKFLDSGSPEYDNPPKISDPRVRRDLELIDYYGPKYVHCKYCHRRNLEYYENAEPNQCLKLTGYLKKVRLGGDDNDEEEKKNKK
jgi:hypothetical protein